MKRLMCTLVLTLVAAVAGAQPPPAQGGFVPIDQLPAVEPFPAAPLVIAAYAVAWVLVLLYVWSVWRRLDRVERELREVLRRLRPGAQA